MNIIELAKQAGIEDSLEYDHLECTEKSLAVFANLVAAQEREECAKVCDDEYFAFVAADKIRARGEK